MVGIQRSRVWWVHRGAGYGGYTEEQGTVGTQRSRVWWVHRGAEYGGYTEEQGKVGSQRSRVWCVHREAGYGGYTEEQGMVGSKRSRVWWVHRGARYGGYTEEQGMVGTQRSRVCGYAEEQGMVGTQRSTIPCSSAYPPYPAPLCTHRTLLLCVPTIPCSSVYPPYPVPLCTHHTLLFCVIALNDNDLGCTQLLGHRINTSDALPVRQPAQRLPFHQQGEVRGLIDDMLSRGIIEPYCGPWASPIVLVKKKDNSTRFCVDFCGVNDLTHKEAQLFPRIDNM